VTSRSVGVASSGASSLREHAPVTLSRQSQLVATVLEISARPATRRRRLDASASAINLGRLCSCPLYASLDRLDLGFELPDGRRAIFLQNDHRDPRTITEQASLSVIFAITCCLLAHQVALQSGRRPFQVVYAMESEPPSFLAYVVAAAGAVVTKGPPRELTVAPAPRMGELEKLIGDAVRQLAAETWTREEFAPSLAGLAAYEFKARYRERPEDPIAYYTRIVTLGALVASVLLPKLDDARWIPVPGVVPFALAGRRGDQEFPRLDVFGKAQQFVDHGLGHSPSAFVAAVTGEVVDLGDPFAPFTRLRGQTSRRSSLDTYPRRAVLREGPRLAGAFVFGSLRASRLWPVFAWAGVIFRGRDVLPSRLSNQPRLPDVSLARCARGAARAAPHRTDPPSCP
jgi:hypothetical protein